MQKKYVALTALVIQNAILALVMRYSRTSTPTNQLYITSTAVFMSELVKFIVSSGLFFIECDQNYDLFKKEVSKEFGDYWTVLKLSVPSLLYTIQNNLQYVAVSNLNVAVYQVLYQLKTVTTALFFVWILGKRLSGIQWLSILVLTFGVSLVQLSASNMNDSHTNQMIGFIAVLASCVTSGYAGVLFEKLLKMTKSSIWMRNMQLGAIGMTLGLFGVYVADYNRIQVQGFFFGYNSITVAVIFLQAVGGLVVAAVVKHADNVLKGFATSISIILSCVASYVVFGTVLNLLFAAGTFFVILSAYAYNVSPVVVATPAAVDAALSKQVVNGNGSSGDKSSSV